MNDSIAIMIHNLTDPDDELGRSYKEVNNTKQHKFPINSLVELKNGVRLFVNKHTRDCDCTPLYNLSDVITEPGYEDYVDVFRGYSEDGMTLV